MRATVRLAASLLCLVAALVSATGAAQGYPTRPIRFIAPFPPGGSSDVLYRLLGQKLTERLGHTELGRIVQLADGREKCASLGVETGHSTPEEVTARIKADTLEVAKVLAAAGVEPE